MLWLAAVCAGSQDLRAAAQAVRDSSLAQRLVQWELGELWAADSLPLPVLTVLRQSPMLLAAETQVTQAETPRNAEGTPSPAPAETPEGPTTEQTENTGGQGESRPLSVVAADENGYTRVGDVFIKNSSRQTVEGIVFDGTFAAALGEDARREIKFLDGTTVQMQAGTVSAILARERTDPTSGQKGAPTGYQVYYFCDKGDHTLLLE